jgi:ubiquinone/menaquinone biosynthesis C-methylase UbiE
MSSYRGRHAQLYDLFYADKPYREEAAFVHHCLAKFGAPGQEILELACGTGRHAVELEKYGYRITATDQSPDMIKVAQERAAESGSKITFKIGDMRTPPTSPTEYDAVICLFDSIGYLRTNDAIGEMLAGVRQSLRLNGLFIVEFWHASAMLNHYSPTRTRRWQTANGEVERISETTLDQKNNLANVDYTIHELNKDGSCSTLREMHTNRYFSVEEMKALISAADLEALQFFAGFQEQQPIAEDTWHIVAVVRK